MPTCSPHITVGQHSIVGPGVGDNVGDGDVGLGVGPGDGLGVGPGVGDEVSMTQT
jgi:hypothetical protein